MKKPAIVVLGGGTGTHTLLKGLKQYVDRVELTAVISMADSGGSTGRLRDEFGQLPVGDVRMALTALASDYNGHEELLRELFLYRFAKGAGLSGHNFGNLLLTALTDLLGSETEAVKAAGRILRIQGQVLPVTFDDVQLVAEYDDGLVVEGEHMIDVPALDRAGHRIVSLTTKPVAKLSQEAKEAIVHADLVVIGPGDLYSSLLANLVVAGVPEAIKQSQGRVVYVANLMERFGQTEGMSVGKCSQEVAQYLGRQPDVVVLNSQSLPVEAVEFYRTTEGVGPVLDDADSLDGQIVRADLLSQILEETKPGDTLKRSLIRHDPDKLSAAVVSLL